MTRIAALLQGIGEQPSSIALRESAWVYPGIETAHVLGLCLFLGLAVLLDLRLLGGALRRTPVSEFVARVMPWTWAGFALMVVTGLLLFYSDPVRFAGNVFFQIKVVLLVLAGLNAAIFHTTVYRRIASWDTSAATPRAARVAGGVSLCAWAGIVLAGRMIAYNWF